MLASRGIPGGGISRSDVETCWNMASRKDVMDVGQRWVDASRVSTSRTAAKRFENILIETADERLIR